MRALTMVATIILISAGCASRTGGGLSVELVGVVVDERSQPVSGAAVRIGAARAITDSFGRFRLSPLVPGRRDVHVSHDRHTPASRTVTIEGSSMLLRIRVLSIAEHVDRAIAAAEAGDHQRFALIATTLQRYWPDDERVALVQQLVSPPDHRLSPDTGR